MTAVAGALGSIIGYLGAEVGDDSIFERLLWAPRYYNQFNVFIFFQMGLLMPMGGPLHRAALAALDNFRNKGLYAGARRGHMLGSAFMRDIGVSYCKGGVREAGSVRDEARNGFWVEVLRHVKVTEEAMRIEAPRDLEAVNNGVKVQRAAQKISHLVLKALDAAAKPGMDCVLVRETVVSWQSVAGIVMSEITALAVALVTGIYFGNTWLAVFFCIPIVLKLASVVCTVRREPLVRIPALERSSSKFSDREPISFAEKGSEMEIKQASGQYDIIQHFPEMYEIDDIDYGFAVIESPPAIMLQFFQHYGHPIRTLKMDRCREIMGICLCYAFVLYFPAGLLAILWMDPGVQYMWLGYQVFTITAMHLVRLFGWGNCGRTEKRIADLLTEGKEVWLCDENGPNIAATIKVDEAPSILVAREMVRIMLAKHRKIREAAEEEMSESISG